MMPSKGQKLAGLILTVLVGLLLSVSAAFKFMDGPGKEEAMSNMGIPLSILPTIGIIEIAFTLLFLIPRTSFLGAILVTAYLGGAVFTHMRIGEPWFMPIIIGVVVWFALGLRKPMIFKLALGAEQAARATSQAQ